MKRPAFQFYPGDWLRSTDLRTCSIGARGLWIDMICLMHDAIPYGYLMVNGNAIHMGILARMVGADEHDIDLWLSELERAGVFSRDEAGAIYSRRMVRDEELRVKRGMHGGKSQSHPDVPKKKERASRIPSMDTIRGSIGGSPASASSTAIKDLAPPPGVASTLALPDDALTKPPTPLARVNPPVPAAGRGRRLDVEVLPDDWRAFCVGDRPDLEPARTFAGFRDFWIARPGAAGVKLDWFATWRNWVRKEKPVANGKNGNHVPDDWWRSDAGIQRKGVELGIRPNPGESMASFRDRVQSRINDQGQGRAA